ncbi:GTPase Era [Acaryochloris thomasi RCC1774]|uniref:GTPase Era n=1 Tax=Acaryochloris thomasi RCC1774 TaxID=1764569 RepID=A0A2W1JWM0_9CYAN|nr:GTPase Era [Acaryochloris thomasi]PZD72787.1 GTPase Era [Acaryochloris thomasi RCC1774]
MPLDALSGMAAIPAAPTGFHSGFVGLIGRPNVGKSTLMNQFVGQKVAITSPIAQTTRNRLRGILTTPDAQVIFIDTPGIHKPHHQLGKIIVKNAQRAINSVDVVLFMVDSCSPPGGGDRYILELLTQIQTPIVLGLNKVDQQESQSAERLDTQYQTLADEQGWPVQKFSALTAEGLEDLQAALIARLPAGPYYYPPDLVTDQPERFIMGELIREQILLQTRQEIPHSVAITIDRVEESPKITRVLATIHAERPSQKAILIGKKGSMLKEIGSAARQQMQTLVDGQIYLELYVKVQPKWRQSKLHLADLGYRVEAE